MPQNLSNEKSTLAQATAWCPQATSHHLNQYHYIDVIMTTMASQITSLTMVYSTVYSDANQKKISKLRITGLCVGNSPEPVNSPHKGPVTRKMFTFGDVIMLKVPDPCHRMLHVSHDSHYLSCIFVGECHDGIYDDVIK